MQERCTHNDDPESVSRGADDVVECVGHARILASDVGGNHMHEKILY